MDKNIIFQGYNFNYIYFLLFLISYFIIDVIDYRYISKGFMNFEKSIIMLDIYIKTFSLFLAFIPFLIQGKCSNKKKWQNR